MTRERPILFSAPMIRAILAGKKTMTRRIVKLPRSLVGDLDTAKPDDALWGAAGNGGLKVWLGDEMHRLRSPYGHPGDTIWCKETWKVTANKSQSQHAIYAADLNDDEREAGKPWRPSIYMPRWASRLTLRITSVRVERLQDITDADARAEGIGSASEFASLWDGINAKRGAWATNPFVWVVSFERVGGVS